MSLTIKVYSVSCCIVESINRSPCFSCKINICIKKECCVDNVYVVIVSIYNC